MRHVRWIGFLLVMALALAVSGAAMAAPAAGPVSGAFVIHPDAADGCPPGPRPTLY